MRDEFGGPNEKRIRLLPNLETNKGMLEGLFDSEGTVTKYVFRLRMSGNLQPIQIVCKQLGIQHGPLHKGVCDEDWQSTPNFHGYSISNKEYTRVGLGTYIKRKAINGITYKPYDL